MPPVLFQQRFHAGLRDGSVTLTFRLWTKPRVRPGVRYRVPPMGEVVVDSVEQVRLGAIGNQDARRAGFEDVAELARILERVGKRTVSAETMVYCVAFHYAGPIRAETAAQRAAAAAKSAELEDRLARMDRLSRSGVWTGKVLGAIAARPGVRAAELAESVEMETSGFKERARRLKKLGLVRSLDVGYELRRAGRELARRRS